MKHLFIPYELAVIAKEKGFNEPCFGFYDNNKRLIIGYTAKSECELIHASLYQQIADWLREKHNIHIVIDFNAPDLGYSYTIYYEREKKTRELDGNGHDEKTEKEFSYYEALTQAIEKAFKLI